LEIRYYWSVIRKRLWLVALITAVCCTVVGFYSFRVAVPLYEASAKLIVNRSGPQNQEGIPDAGSITSDIMLIKTYREIIRTPRILNKVVEQYPELRTTVRELSAKVRVGSVNDTLVMSVSAVDADPERAARMANAVSRVFQQEIQTLMNIDNVFILNWADPSENRSPISPRPIRNIVIAFAVSTMAGVGFVFLWDKLNGAIRTEQDILATLELPVLAEIPRIRRRDRRNPDKPAGITTPAGRKPHVTFDS